MKTQTSSKRILFLLAYFVLVFDGFSQEKVEQYNSNGLSTTIFNTSLAKLTVYLPEHNANENVSGTVLIESFGNSDKKKRKNRSEIEQYKLSIGNQSILLRQGVFKLASSANYNSQLRLLNAKGKEIATSHIQSNPNVLDSNGLIHVPPYMVSGESTKIAAVCDGDLTNNSITINNKNVPGLAESESGVFFKAPSNSNGSSLLQFNNEGDIIEATVNVLGLNLAVGRTNLLRGETTNLSINVTGLEGLEDTVPMTITNNTVSNITLEDGNVQQLIINPSTDATSGNYFKSLSIRALQRGGFSISVKVEASSQQNLLCNCYINGQSYLISVEACQELGGNCSENQEEDESDGAEDETPPDYNCEVPSEITESDQSVNLQIEDFSTDDCVAVIFSYRPIDDNQWQIIGSDNTAEDGLQVNWKPALGNDGVYIIRIQVVNVNNITSERQQHVFFNVENQSKNDNSLNVSYSISESDIEREIRKARATGERIKKEEEKLRKLRDKIWDEKDLKKENEEAKNELIVIDKVLDSIPKTYKDDFKRILDSLASLKKKLPDVVDPLVLQKAIDDAQSRVDDCNKRLEALKREQADLEKERDDLKGQLDDVQEAFYKLHIDNGWVGGYGYHSDGRPWHGYVGGERANTDLGDEKYKLKKQYRELKKQYLKNLKRLGQLPAEISEAEEDCEELSKALEKAKTAKETTDLHAATELEAEDICRQIKRLLRSLRRWCHNNPDHCDFKDKLKKLLEECPKDVTGLENLWNELDNIIAAKKEKEKAFGDAADVIQDTIDALENEIEKLKDKIRALNDQRDKEYAEAERKLRQRYKELAEAKTRAAAKKRERDKQKKEDERIMELIKKARSGDAGEEALKDLAKGMGLDLLDEATGSLKLGKIIGGILVIKNMPDCVCPLIKALRDAIAAHRRGEDPFVYVNDYIMKWKKCVNLPSISSIMEGSQQLTEAIQEMSKEQSLRAINALNQAIRVQCK